MEWGGQTPQMRAKCHETRRLEAACEEVKAACEEVRSRMWED
jgi:hypothetical protein